MPIAPPLDIDGVDGVDDPDPNDVADSVEANAQSVTDAL
jgi:hypothetical protein